MRKTTDQEKLHAFLKKTIRCETRGCLIWSLGIAYNGYGRTKFRGKTQRSHRVSWMLHNGPIPEGLLVLHKCDIRACVNPDHLFLGTQLDNMRDRNAKGRANVAFGEGAGGTKLRAEDVVRIRKLKAKHTYKELSELFGVTQMTLCDLVKRRTWAHLE